MKDFDIFGNQTMYYKSSENMEELANDSIDTIITSPPYNRKKIYSDDFGLAYDDNKPLKEYLGLLKKVWKECLRVLRPNGILFLNIGDSAQTQGLSEKVVHSASESGFYWLQTIIWIKSFLGRGHYTPSGGTRRLNNLWENVFILVKDRKKYSMNPKAIGVPYADRSNIGRYSDENLRDAGNVWLIPYSKTTGATIKKGHEAPFPIELPYKCIKLSDGNKILDPFAGTGTTLAAARILGKKGFGYEKYPKREVIKQKIMLSSFEPPILNLIPHLELTIEYLARIVKKLNPKEIYEHKKFHFTKKEQNEIEIVNDVLTNLDIGVPLFQDYLSKIEIRSTKPKSIGKGSLIEYFEKKE